jgi:3-hydroxyisobutyrate dehydrogenase-like beta-hydroxyacid dehydrogenase
VVSSNGLFLWVLYGSILTIPAEEKGGNMQRIGFIGIGLMGKEMTRRLLEAGYPLAVWNRTKDKVDPLVKAGATWGHSPKALAEAAEVVITMVTDSAASEEVICGKNGVLEGAHPGLVLIDMGSIAPEMSRSIAGRAQARGVPMLDAPVTGNPKVAADGKLGIMVGGPRGAFDACLPILGKMGAKIIHVGENGKGTTLKLINNLIMGVAIQAVAEGLVLAMKAGIDPQKVVEITSVGGARTGAMETRGPRMIKRDFSPHFSANNMYKDLSSALKLAEEVGASLPATSIAREMLRAVKSRGDGNMDSSMVLTVIEAMANIRPKVEG